MDTLTEFVSAHLEITKITKAQSCETAGGPSDLAPMMIWLDADDKTNGLHAGGGHGIARSHAGFGLAKWRWPSAGHHGGRYARALGPALGPSPQSKGGPGPRPQT
ncbi:MAG: hypothetical protein EBW15_07025, partial [Actinobacteria bacterium]|nr:hypothetical protein [Actinomycetota bacterium]